MTYGVIFDMDGVLVDSYRAHFESWLRLAKAHGLTMTEEQFAATFGRTSREIIRKFWPDKVKDDAEVTAWDHEKEQDYRDILMESFPEMKGASQLLAALHGGGFKLAIGSSGPPENVRVTMDGLGMAECFGATVSGADVTHGKPHPEVFLKAAAKLGLEPKNCAVVEDAPAGVAAAKAAGMAAVAITGTATRQQLAQADTIVDCLTQVTPDLVLQLIRRNGGA